jgi:hypothetical protein
MLVDHARKIGREAVHKKIREEYYKGIHEHTRLCACTRNYNRREDTTNCVDNGEIQT